MISSRSKSSLSQYLTLHNPPYLRILFSRDGISLIGMMEQAMECTSYVIDDLGHTVFSATPEQLLSLLNHMIKTSGDLRNRISPHYRHDELWNDLFHCLQLDGYKIEGHDLIAFEPEIEGVISKEDDFTTELKRSSLETIDDILRLLDNSAEDFRKSPPDYNGCLTNARIALETLVKSIASHRKKTHPGSFDETKWAQVLAYLRTSGLITQKEEEGISGVYSFVSPGAHVPIGLSDQEMARLGRSLAISMCYFLVKRYNNGQP